MSEIHEVGTVSIRKGKKMKKGILLLLSMLVFATLVFCIVEPIFIVEGATSIRADKTLSISAVDATPLDGSTTGRTYQAADRTAAYCIVLNEEADAVIITIDGTGADGNSAVFNIYGYGADGGADRIYHTVTATLGTAVAGTSRLFADQISGTDTHVTTVAVRDSGANGNTRAKIALDTTGLKYLMFEATTFTTLTVITFHVREYGLK